MNLIAYNLALKNKQVIAEFCAWSYGDFSMLDSMTSTECGPYIVDFIYGN
ncbi:hypothetical protein OLZ31_02585 [Enterobacter asburiae]|nr:hypothetical protein [Enterobacter asburiae]